MKESQLLEKRDKIYRPLRLELLHELKNKVTLYIAIY